MASPLRALLSTSVSRAATGAAGTSPAGGASTGISSPVAITTAVPVTGAATVPATASSKRSVGVVSGASAGGPSPPPTATSGAALAPEAAAAAAPASHIPSKSWTCPQGHAKIQLPFPARKLGKPPEGPELLGPSAAASAAAASEASLKRASDAASAACRLRRTSAAAAARDLGLVGSASPPVDPRTCPKPSPLGACPSSSPLPNPWNWAAALLSAACPLWLQKRWNRMY
mmetsp:Transcript_110452/g.330390  ORF Transcript_110452/g.330390 Transcript_110452/m.330390 type:complete len:230 (+) Transcript_110452:755-1444(+)